jgi:competence protein ComEC
LAQAGARVVRTDIDGAIAVHASNHNLSLQRAKRWTRILSWY